MGLFDKMTELEKIQAKENKAQAKADVKEDKNKLKLEANESMKENKDKFKQELKERKPKSLIRFKLIGDSTNTYPAKSPMMLLQMKDNTFLIQGQLTNSFAKIKDSSVYNLVDVEWLEDIENKGRKVVGRSIAGAMIAGPAGMIIGGVTGKDKVKDKSVAVITLQNQDTHKLVMFSFKCTAREIQKYQLLTKTPLIEDEKVVQVEVVDASIVDSLDQLKKLKELLDIEAITQDEYDTKKAQLLAQ